MCVIVVHIKLRHSLGGGRRSKATVVLVGFVDRPVLVRVRLSILREGRGVKEFNFGAS